MKNKREIFQDILVSAETNCVLKIKLKNQPNPVITAVDKIDNDKIILKPTCLYGFRIKKPTITLAEIERVTRYKTLFNTPVFEKLRFVKSNISAIRHDFQAFRKNPGSPLNRA